MLAGVLRGCGRQKIGATINLAMYWGMGLPFACLLAFKVRGGDGGGGGGGDVRMWQSGRCSGCWDVTFCHLVTRVLHQ